MEVILQRKSIILTFVLLFTFIIQAAAPAEYTKAYKLYSKKKYEKSYAIFQNFIDKKPNDFYTGNCFFWKGIIDYRAKKYEKALIDFSQVLTCSNKYKYADARLRLGLTYLKLGNKDAAKREFEKIIKYYPDSPKKVKQAKNRLKKIN